MAAAQTLSDSDVVALIADELRHKRTPLRFAPNLEARFEADTGLERSRHLFWQGLFGIAFCFIYLIADWELTQDQFLVAVALRVGIVVPVGLIVLTLLWFNPRPFWRESVAAAMCILVTLSTYAVMFLSESPFRDGQPHSIVLVILYLTMVLRLRFTYALVTCLMILASYAWALSLLPGYLPERFVSDNLILGGAVVMALMAALRLDREARYSYLMRTRGRMLNSALEDISRHDPMTGLGNRRSLERALEEVRTSAAPEEGVAIVLFDLDHFKAYNDGLGHVAGDTCLKRVAGIIDAQMRTGTDVAFRFGGEEFLVLLRGTDLPTALAVAERMRRAIEDSAMPHPTRSTVTASFGVAATLIGGAISNDELIQAADAALYAAKRNGRNQVWPPFLMKGGEVIVLADRKSAG